MFIMLGNKLKSKYEVNWVMDFHLITSWAGVKKE